MRRCSTRDGTGSTDGRPRSISFGDLLLECVNSLLEHVTMSGRARPGEIVARLNERELERAAPLLRGTLFGRERPAARPGALRFRLLEFDVLALEASRHSMNP